MTSVGTGPARDAACSVAVAGLLALSGCGGEHERDNVLLIVVDTLRADHLSCYGYGRETSPCIDRLAAQGLVFTHAESPRAKTTPAVTSLLTGLYPHDHGVRDFTTPLRRDVPTLAGLLRARGWRTAAIVGNYVLRDELSGLAHDFDTWIEELPTTRGVPPDDVPERTADSITARAITLLEELEGPPQSAARPWFLWLHYMDPHGLYEPPAEHAIFHATTSAPIDDHEAGPGEPPLRVATYNVPPEAWLPDGRIDAAPVVDRYDGEIHFADAEIGRLIDRLRETGQLEHTWVILVADHGESLGERRYWFEHGAYAHEATCRVPLIVHPPLALRDRPAPGLRESDVALADVAPTLLALLGEGELPAGSSDVRGSSRAALLQGDDDRAHPVFCEKVDAQGKARAVQTKAVRVRDWKLVRRLVAEQVGAGEPLRLRLLSEELYDLSRDAAEAHDLAASAPTDAPLVLMRAALEDFIRADRALPDLDRTLGERARALQSEDADTARRLHALGY